MKEITVQELKQLQDSGADFQLIDVREEFEYEIANLGGELIPLSTITADHKQITHDKQVIVHCKMGGRSANAIRLLEQNFGYTNLYNLKGGIIAYANEIDPTLEKY